MMLMSLILPSLNRQLDVAGKRICTDTKVQYSFTPLYDVLKYCMYNYVEGIHKTVQK